MPDLLSYATGRGYMASPFSKLPERLAVAHARWWWDHLSEQLGPGVPLFSPVVASAGTNLRWTWEQWMQWSFGHLSGCTFVIVPPIPGREESRGVAAEVEWAEARNMAVLWL